MRRTHEFDGVNPLGIVGYIPPRRISRDMRIARRLLRAEIGVSLKRFDPFKATHLAPNLANALEDLHPEGLENPKRSYGDRMPSGDRGQLARAVALDRTERDQISLQWHSAYSKRNIDALARVAAVRLFRESIRRPTVARSVVAFPAKWGS